MESRQGPDIGTGPQPDLDACSLATDNRTKPAGRLSRPGLRAGLGLGQQAHWVGTGHPGPGPPGRLGPGARGPTDQAPLSLRNSSLHLGDLSLPSRRG